MRDDVLFRRESGRLVAALTRILGPHNLALAEDVAQDSLGRAVQVWRFAVVPPNPSGWLLTTAKNHAMDLLRRERTARKLAPELGRLLDSEWTLSLVMDEMLDPRALRDDLLRMMFSCCHPGLPEEVQVALVLHILCGFGTSEIASAFLTNEAAVKKRLTRGKKALAESTRLFDICDEHDFEARLPAVHLALYLLFNEGYHGSDSELAVRAELCGEALHLARKLLEHRLASTPATHALAALMCLNEARLAARLNASGALCSFSEQDRSIWDLGLITQGLELLGWSAAGTELTEYHVQAAIASVYAGAARAEDTSWAEIVSLYDVLMTIRPSPVVALHRGIAIAQLHGPERGLHEIRAIADAQRLEAYPFYYGALGELAARCGDEAEARCQFRAALELARNPAERRFFEEKIAACDSSPLTCISTTEICTVKPERSSEVTRS